jgi:hypothetical protein
MTEYDSDVCVLGYRRWRIVGPAISVPEHTLIGSWRNVGWPVGEPMVAKCLSYTARPPCTPGGPIAGNKNCMCGLHLFFSLEDAENYTHTSGGGGYVIGIAAGGGRVRFDNKYARCEIADVICLIDPIEYPQSEYISTKGKMDRTERIREWAKAAAARYRVPLLSHYDAVDFAMEFGNFVSAPQDFEDGTCFIEGVD